jgi:ABC-type oligopeptide transport system ATPase subunit
VTAQPLQRPDASYEAELAATNALVEAENIKVHFPITAGLFQRTVGAVRAVDDISFDIRKGETLGLVGESGCGKSTTGRALIRLRELTEGRVKFDGVDLTTLKRDQLRKMRRRMQIIFRPVQQPEPADDGGLDHLRADRDP